MRTRCEKETFPRCVKRFCEVVRVCPDDGAVLGNKIAAEDLLWEVSEVTLFEIAEYAFRNLGFHRDIVQRQTGALTQSA